MIKDFELVERFHQLDAATLHDWIDEGLLKPHRDASGYLFDDVDQARIALICDLHYSMGLGDESLPVVLSLIDQLHRTRHSLRAISTAVSEQPDEIRVAISSRTQIVLATSHSSRAR
jgi:chaperone modulatory protein CbpM